MVQKPGRPSDDPAAFYVYDEEEPHPKSLPTGPREARPDDKLSRRLEERGPDAPHALRPHGSSVPNPKFARACCDLFSELRIRKDARIYNIRVA